MLRRGQRIRVVILCGLIISALGPVAIATDSEDAVVLPSPEGWIPNSASVEKTTISIEEKNVSVNFKIMNPANVTLTLPLTIYPVRFSWGGFGIAYFDKHFPELTILNDGEKMRLRSNVTAYLHGKDVSSILIKNKIDPLLVGDDAGLIPAKTRRGKSLPSLVKRGLLVLHDGNLYAAWSAQVAYSWEQPFPAKTSTTIEMKFRARPAYDVFETASHRLHSLLSLHCATQESVFPLFKDEQGKIAEYLVVERYVISAALAGHQSNTVSLNFYPSSDLGVKPIMALACNGESMVVGRPAIKNAAVSNRDGQISILVLSLQ